MSQPQKTSGKGETNMPTFTIDSHNNITALAGFPAGAEESQSFSTPKELAKLTAEWPASRLVETWNSFAGVAPFDDLKLVKTPSSASAARWPVLSTRGCRRREPTWNASTRVAKPS
jgi:hypothetical protein